MRVLMISGLHIWSLGKGKGAASFYETIQGYIRQGHQVELIISNRCEGVEHIPNLEVHHFNLPLLRRLSRIPKLGFFFFIIWWLVFECIAIVRGLILTRCCPPDIIYGYEIFGVPAAGILGKLLHCPSVARFQGTVMWPRMQQPLWRLRYWKHYVALKWPVDLVIMANDGTQGDKVLQALGVDSERVCFWMNGVDRTFLQPVSQALVEQTRQELGLDKSCAVLLTLSRLVSWKRVDRIIKALPAIVVHTPNAHLVVVGDGEARRAYEELVYELAMDAFVTFVGAVPHEAVKRYLALADIFVSLYDLSNLGNPLLEAMMMGKCIVTLNKGATSSVIEHNVNGVLLDPSALNELPNTIVALLEDNKCRTELGNHARLYAEQSFWSWEGRMNQEVRRVGLLLSDFEKD